MGKDKFTYYNRETGKPEQMPMKPSYIQRVYENVVYPEDIDKQREAAARRERIDGTTNTPDDGSEN